MSFKKFGQKSLAGASKFGQKATHGVAKFGQKSIGTAAMVGAIAAPELAVPLEIGSMVGRPVLKTIERASR